MGLHGTMDGRSSHSLSDAESDESAKSSFNTDAIISRSIRGKTPAFTFDFEMLRRLRGGLS